MCDNLVKQIPGDVEREDSAALSIVADEVETLAPTEVDETAIAHPGSFVGSDEGEAVGVGSSYFENAQLTRVESLVNPNIKLVPEPHTLKAVEPTCGVYTGAGYGRSEVNLKNVDLIEEKIVYKKKVQVIQRPVEVIRKVVKPIVKQVVEFRKVVDENDVVEVPVPYKVETRKYVPNFIDTGRYAVMKEHSLPHVVFDEDALEVPCINYVPEVHVVPIQVPKVVDGSIVCKKGLTRLRRLSELTKPEWNALVLKMNPKLCEIGDLELFPVYKSASGEVIALKPEAI